LHLFAMGPLSLLRAGFLGCLDRLRSLQSGGMYRLLLRL